MKWTAIVSLNLTCQALAPHFELIKSSDQDVVWMSSNHLFFFLIFLQFLLILHSAWEWTSFNRRRNSSRSENFLVCGTGHSDEWWVNLEPLFLSFLLLLFCCCTFLLFLMYFFFLLFFSFIASDSNNQGAVRKKKKPCKIYTPA